MTLRNGPLTRADLQAIWEGALDKSYRDALLKVGDGNGLEAHSVLWEVMGRVSDAIDRTTQGLYFAPWSGETNPSALGGVNAQVTLTLTRTRRTDQPIYLEEGFVVVLEETTDWSESGGETIQTGRRYVLKESVLFYPGDSGPKQVLAEADRPGYGFNNPRPGSLKSIEQPGVGFENDHATVVIGINLLTDVTIATQNEADTFIPEQLGQYLEFTAGLNTGAIARMTRFTSPDLSVPRGSQMSLEQLSSYTATVFAGTFAVGEVVTFAGFPQMEALVVGEQVIGGLKTIVVSAKHATTAITLPTVGTVVTGAGSGATMTINHVLTRTNLVAEAPVGPIGGASWRVLDWMADLGVVSTNVQSPTGGRAAMLDELARERNIARAPGEPDDIFVERLQTVGDKVSPNAIRRALNRTMGAIPWCFREVGTPQFRGFFYDGDTDLVPGAGSPQSTTLLAADLLDAYDTYVLLLTPSAGVPFVEGDHLVLERISDGLIYAEGYYCRVDGGANIVFTIFSGRLPTVAEFGAGVQLRKVGTGTVQVVTAGVFPSSSVNRRFRTWVDFEQMRAFFLVGVPMFDLDDFGFAFDVGAHNAYDVILDVGNAFDGSPIGNPGVYSRIYQAINETKAAGVGFQLYEELIGCP